MNEQTFHDDFYAEEARLFTTPLFQRIFARSAAAFVGRGGLGRASVVLSLGCGDGHIERKLAPHVARVVAVDISPVGIARARRLAAEAGVGNVEFEVADLSRPGAGAFASGSFDAVCAFAFFHHLDDAAIAALLASARRLLKPGGVMYSSDPSTRRLLGLFRGLVKSTYERTHSPDERELDPDAIVRAYQTAGFTDTTLGYFDFMSGPLAWLAPRTPSVLSGPIDRLDRALVRVPGLRRYSSSFEVVGRA
jgi:SAM-dependent methyltransferase